jgi:hypothetical protein
MENPAKLEIEQLLHPARAFRHPKDVVDDANLSLAEKRAILASWASDACALESSPALRSPEFGVVVRYDDIIDALQALDAHPVVPIVSRPVRERRKRRMHKSRRGGSTPSYP